MILTKDGDRTILDGETHTTFIKAEKFDGSALHVTGMENTSIQRFHWINLTRNPFKDCWTLLRWYFSRG